MTPTHGIWVQRFLYRDGEAIVTRLPRGWRLTIGVRGVEAPTLVVAFQMLRDREAGDDEMRVVDAAHDWDHAHPSLPNLFSVSPHTPSTRAPLNQWRRSPT